MYIKCVRTFYSGSEQRTSAALFLILMDKQGGDITEIRAIVRKVSLHQCGQWMMGRCFIKGKALLLSGAYGADGLSCTVSEKIFNEGVALPAELYKAWNKGGGWNSAGSEAVAMREWALENLDKLYRVKNKK